MDRWIDKVAVVTGASAGIGSATCLALADAGIIVVGLARRPHLVDKLQSQVVGKGRIVSKHCDVSKPAELTATFQWIEESYGGVDILVNNAGALFDGQITDVGNHTLSEAEIEATVDTNVKGLIICTRHAVASMKRRGFNGHIVNISRSAKLLVGHYVPTTPTFNVYPCTKHAVRAFGGQLNNEFARFHAKIKVTSLNPGLVTTDLAAGLIDTLQVPVLHPRDIAAGVIYAISTPPHVNITELTITAVEQPSL